MIRLIAFLSVPLFALTACGGSDAETAELTSVVNDAETAVSEATDPGATETETAPEIAAAEETEPQSIPAPEGSLAGEDMFLGSPDAPLVLVEYASVTCPGCAAFHEQIFPELKEKYIDTGKVKLEFREFPTNPQNLAYAGFYLARCAATDNGAPAYFAMIKTLFERQREWAYGPTPGEEIEKIAAQAGIDRDGLEECFFREEVKAAVKANVVRGLEEDNVRATPSFFANGEEFDWGRSKEEFFSRLDEKLAEVQ